MNNKWVERFFKRAEQISTWSKDPSSKIGCVFIDEENKIELSAGYNGFPRGIQDLQSRYDDRETKLKFTSHAEMNGIYNASRIGTSLLNSSLFVYGLPVCSECAKGIIQVGVKRVYLKAAYVKLGVSRWKESWELTKLLFIEAEVEIIIID